MMEFKWKPSVETVIRCILTFILLIYGSMAPPPLGLAQKGQCSPLYLLNKKESTRNSAWLSNWGYTEVVSHQCERPNVLWDQSGKEPKIGSSPLLCVEKHELDIEDILIILQTQFHALI